MATEVLNMPVTDRNARLGKPVVRNVDMPVVIAALDKSATFSDILKIGKKLGEAGGWREEFELYHQAETKFPDKKVVFQARQQDMAVSRQIHRQTYYELGGLQRLSERELLRIVEDL